MTYLLQHLYNSFPISYKKQQTVLVLGFYDRQNAGDEMYKIAIPRIFSDTRTKFVFVCMDDIKEIPDNIEFVICGGGDIINHYFMQKAEKLFATYTGRVYAFSVGIPYNSEAKYLHMFDHVFVRSKTEYAIASKEVGAKNVTYLPDASFSLIKSQTQTNVSKTTNIALCLAQPAFHNNPQKDNLLDAITTALVKLYRYKPNIRITLMTFNYFKASTLENDYVVNDAIYEKLRNKDIPVMYPKDLDDPLLIFQKISTMDIVIGMRYHSILFGIINRKTVIPIYCTPKIEKIIPDLSNNIFGSLKFDTNAKGMPTFISHDILYATLKDALTNNAKYKLPDTDWSIAKKIMFDDKKFATLLVKNSFDSFESVLYICKRTLMKYLQWSSTKYESILSSHAVSLVGDHIYTNVARLICYCITKSIQSSYLWGLQDNMQQPNFCLYDAIEYIWQDCNTIEQQNTLSKGEQYYPTLNVDRKVFVNLDLVFNNDFKSYHRSGWAYVVGGMMNLDSHQLLRNGNLMVDTYVDRSFHWGLDTLQTVDIIPYTATWIGFVHHTYDITHSSYNCVELFSKQCFLDSLKTCKGLIALTTYLQKHLQASLISHGYSNIPVQVIYHPMEFVENYFTVDKFIKNPNRKIVQIGAWLRNAYAIYELPLWRNKLALQKAALKGKEMDHYFRPNDLLVTLKKDLLKTDSDTQNISGNAVSGVQCISGNQVSYTANNVNKYCAGLYQMIEENDKSVEILERLTNDEYDKLLTENITFLNLVDCSAVNTVLECLVRNTPIIVNRHPAIEEILGESYPGFYDDIVDAALLINDMKRIEAAHTHLKKLDKTKYTLEYFLVEFQNFVLSVS